MARDSRFMGAGESTYHGIIKTDQDNVTARYLPFHIIQRGLPGRGCRERLLPSFYFLSFIVSDKVVILLKKLGLRTK